MPLGGMRTMPRSPSSRERRRPAALERCRSAARLEWIDWADCDEALAAATEAAALLRTTPPVTLARFLDVFVARIEARQSELVEMAHAETGLPRRVDGEWRRGPVAQ